ncbi:MAG TPA: DHH family phosphoesterase [Chitinophagaceae bacterium]|nr:DHH family phosphoesterase [Chitinophagaceae bacterium]
MKNLTELVDILATPQKIAITYHHNPDADALGSSLGLCQYLQSKGHQCQVISPNSIPDFLMWMPQSASVLIYEDSKTEVEKILDDSTVLFSLDYNQYSRTHALGPALSAFVGTTVLIDHHLFPDPDFEFGLSLPSKSSTCEMVYDFINLNDDNMLITTDIAKCLYAGAMTDTGSFKFSCTTAGVHLMVADFMHKGLDTTPIHQAIFDTYEENRLRFLGYVLSEKMIVNADLHAAIIPINKEDMNRFQLKTGDTEGIVNFPLSIKDIIFSTFISERDNEIRMSFRSKGRFDVNQFARTYFNGGGHANAAGGRSNQSLTDTIETYNNALSQIENQLKQCYKELV